MDEAGIVHEQREDLVVLVLVGQRAVLVQIKERTRAVQCVGNDERQLDHRTAREAVTFGATQSERDIDGAGLHLRGLLRHVAERRRSVKDLDLDLAVGPGLELLGPGFGEIHLEKALGPEKLAELDRNGVGGCAARAERNRREDHQIESQPNRHPTPPCGPRGAWMAVLACAGGGDQRAGRALYRWSGRPARSSMSLALRFESTEGTSHAR